MPGWNTAELALLRAEYPQKGLHWCAQHLGRTPRGVAGKASELGLKQDRTSEFFREWQQRAARSKVGRKRPDQSLVMQRLHAEGRLHTPKWRARQAALCGNDNWLFARSMKGAATRARNGTHTGAGDGAGVYGAGWRVIGGVRKFYRSRWEANYARYLQWRLERGDIARWEHEPETFWFVGIKRGVLSYLPDFRVTHASGRVEYHEVKGWMTPRSKTALKRMAKYHPDVALLLVDSRAYQRIAAGAGCLIKGWET